MIELLNKKTLIKSIITRILNQLCMRFISSSGNIDNLTRKGVLNPTAFIKSLIMQAKFNFPYRVFVFRFYLVASQSKSIMEKVFVWVFIFFDPVIKFIILIRWGYFLWIKELAFFPSAKFEHNFRFFSWKYEGRDSMDDLKLFVFDLLNKKYLIDIILVDFC